MIWKFRSKSPLGRHGKQFIAQVLWSICNNCGMDIDIELLMNLRKFIGEECMAGLYFVERDEALTHNVFGNWRATKPMPVELNTKENMPTPTEVGPLKRDTPPHIKNKQQTPTKDNPTYPSSQGQPPNHQENHHREAKLPTTVAASNSNRYVSCASYKGRSSRSTCDQTLGAWPLRRSY